jgi:hypothetical protein
MNRSYSPSAATRCASVAVLFALLATLPFTTPAQATIISASQNTATQGAGVSAAGSWTGVGNILLDGTDKILNQHCTGTVIVAPQNIWVLTAAHCFYDNAGVLLNPQRLRFNLPEGGITNTFYAGQQLIPHPNYNPANGVTGGFDIGLIKLGVDLAGLTTPWNFNHGEIADERADLNPGIIGTKVGFGLSGDGVNGATGNPPNVPNLGDPDAQEGTKRQGTNFVNFYGPVVAGNAIFDTTDDVNQLIAPANTLIYDFDNHVAGGNGSLTSPNGSFGTATGTTEVDTAPGDSGGPMFMFDFPNNRFTIVGVTSYGTDFADGNPQVPVVGPGPDPGSRFGDIAVDTRVRAYAAWIDQVIVPEPASLTLVLALVAALGAGSRSRRTIDCCAA